MSGRFRPMYDMLTRAAQTRPDAPFLTTPAGSFSFAQFDLAVARRAAGLRRQRIGPGEVVAVFAANHADAVVDLFAVPRTGATLLLLNTRHTDRELADQIATAGAGSVIGTRADLGVRRLERRDGERGPVLQPEQTHTIAFTSGSSGRPLGVRLTWANLEASAAASANHLDHGPDDRWLCVMPLFHVGGLMILIRSALAMSEVVLERRFDPGRTARLLGEVSLASVVPTMLTRLLDVGVERGNLRAVLVGGAGAPRSMLDRAFLEGLPVLSTYGMTETASQLATAPLGSPPTRRVVPIPGAEVMIGQGGEIHVRGPMVSPGYVGEPDRSSGSWLATGDLGVLDEHGLAIIGRKHDRIITGGENVDPLEVELALAEVPGIAEAIVVGLPDSEWGQLVAAVVAGDGASNSQPIEEQLRDRLAGYKVPKRWMVVPGIPRTSIGKPDRRAARALFESFLSGDSSGS